MTNLWKQPVLLHPVLLHPVTAVKTFQDKTGHTWKLGCANTRFHLCFIMESPVSLRHVWTSDHSVSYRYKPVCQPVTVTEIIRKIHLWELKNSRSCFSGERCLRTNRSCTTDLTIICFEIRGFCNVGLWRKNPPHHLWSTDSNICVRNCSKIRSCENNYFSSNWWDSNWPVRQLVNNAFYHQNKSPLKLCRC